MAANSSILAWKSYGQRSLVGYSPWGHKESDTTERLHFTLYSRSLFIDCIHRSVYLLIPKWFLKSRDNWLIAMFWVTTDTQLHELRPKEEERQNTLLLRLLLPSIRTVTHARLSWNKFEGLGLLSSKNHFHGLRPLLFSLIQLPALTNVKQEQTSSLMSEPAPAHPGLESPYCRKRKGRWCTWRAWPQSHYALKELPKRTTFPPPHIKRYLERFYNT